MRTGILIVFYMVISCTVSYTQQLYHTNTAEISFVSEAPLETIRAASDNCQGIVNLENGEFVFRVYIKSFEGFNNRLQQIHFYENYMEANRFPESVFQGFIVEDLNNLQEAGTMDIRAKGYLEIHGVTREKIISVSLESSGNSIIFSSEFEVALKEFDISIPNIVKQKIAETITITVTGTLVRKQ